MPQAADMLLAQMRELGVEPGDLKLIMHSQAHGDHVGPPAAVRRATGATLASNAESAVLLAAGGRDALPFGDQILYPPTHSASNLPPAHAAQLGGPPPPGTLLPSQQP